MANNSDLGASIAKFVAEKTTAAKALAERQEAIMRDLHKEWSDIYDSIPEGHLRTLTESANILASTQSALNRVNEANAENSKLGNLLAPPQSPIIAP